jgi:hypothetical protein
MITLTDDILLNMTLMKKPLFALALAALVLPFVTVPVFAFAHGDVEDGHEEPAVVVAASDGHTDHDHSSGASALLVSGSSAWWGLLFLSLGLTTLLSYGVWKYLQVPAVSKDSPPKP